MFRQVLFIALPKNDGVDVDCCGVDGCEQTSALMTRNLCAIELKWGSHQLNRYTSMIHIGVTRISTDNFWSDETSCEDSDLRKPQRTQQNQGRNRFPHVGCVLA